MSKGSFEKNLLLSIHSLSKSYGPQLLFEDISFTLSETDHVGLIGPNGAGKSSLFKIILALESADSGFITKRTGLRIGYTSQAPEFPSLSLEDFLVQCRPKSPHPEELHVKARILLSKAHFTDFSQDASTLSGGWKKRLDILRALMQEPDLILLDEPTNHLDLEGILWLEKLLMRERVSYIVISHDRYFLENSTNKIIELNRCYPKGIFTSEGSMSTFMERKELFVQAQIEREQSLSSSVRQEVEWLKRSPPARTTKSRSRIQKAYDMLEELASIKKRNTTKRADLDFSASERETRKLLSAKNLMKTLGTKTLFQGVELSLSPGSRVGIVGKNGAGKTTLLRILAGQIPQDMGTIKYAEDLRLVYFDQHREQLPLQSTLRQALSPSGDFVTYRGQQIHVHGWAKKFLFSKERLELPIRLLSGGERARILIARLMLEPADILFLDEPTNDLDIDTLEVIEESLKEFRGALVLISHDRCLMDRICNQIVSLGEGDSARYFAGYQQWEEASSISPKNSPSFAPQEQKNPSSPPSSSVKLSYKEQKELEGIEQHISRKEAEISALEKQLQDPESHADAQRSLKLYGQLSQAQKRLEELFERWQYLENKAPSR